MNFGRGFSIPQENGIVPDRDSWVPGTPGKTILLRSSSIPVEMEGNQLGRSNWQELLGIYSGFLQETTNNDGAVQNSNSTGLMGQIGGHHKWDVVEAEKNCSFNRNPGSYVENLGNDSAAWNNNPLAELLGKGASSAASANGTQNKSIHVRNSSMLTQQNRTSGSNQRNSGYGLPKLANGGFPFPVPYRPDYNLNSPPRSEADASSSVTTLFKFAPVTPDQAKQSQNHQLSEIKNLLVDDCSSQEKHHQDNLTISRRSEDIESRCGELMQNIVDSSTMVKEKNISDGGDEQGIDLNKTPEQKTPKRRKHRPKVVVEGTKRTPKPAAPKNNTSNENPSGKRKYVRKKVLKTSEPQQARVTVHNVESAAKSCRRALNFDLENGMKDESKDRTGSHQAEMHQESKRAFNLNLDSQDTELCKETNSIFGTSGVQIEWMNGYIKENSQSGIQCNLNHSTNQIPARYRVPEQCDPTMPSAKGKDHTLNAIARSVNMRNANLCQNSGTNGYSQVHQHIRGEVMSQLVFQADTTSANLDRTKQLMLQSTSQLVARAMANFQEKRGFKREYCRTTEQKHHHTLNLMGSSGDDNSARDNYGAVSSETFKKKKTGNGFHATISSVPSCITDVKDCSRKMETGGMNGAYANNAASQIKGTLLNSYLERDNINKKVFKGVRATADSCYVDPMAAEHNFQHQQVSCKVQPNIVRMAEKRSQGSTQVHDLNSLTAMTNWNHLSPTTPKAPRCDFLQGIEACHVDMSAKKQTEELTSSNQGTCGTEKMLQKQRKDALEAYQRFSMKVRGMGKQKFVVSVDEITYRLNGLRINGRSNEIFGQEKHALVPYKGSSAIVPYEIFDPSKKSKPRPKVDLDPESDRIWKLLMGKERSESTEATDKDKEKWWEEERKVFRGRAESFVALMHRVQGDRRFSRWKGSVVDSVIGVFLTQNVSDHLSSSAFMSLAAKFPNHYKSTTTSQTCYQHGTSILVEGPCIQILDSDGSTKCNERTGRQPIYNQSSITSCESPEHRIYSLFSGTRSAANEHDRIADEEIKSSQNSFDSSIFQTYEEIRSSSGSTSEAEDRTTGCKPKKNQSPTPVNLLQTERALLDERSTQWYQQSENRECNRQNPRLGRFNNLQGSSAFTCPINSNILDMRESIVSSSNYQFNTTPGSGILEERCFGVSGEESTSYLPSNASGTTDAKGVNHMSIRREHMAESTQKTTAQQNGVPRIQATTLGPYTFLSKHPTHQVNLQPGPHAGNNQHSINCHLQEKSNSFQLERTFVTEPTGSAEALAKRQSGAKQQVFDDPKFTGQTLNTEENTSVVGKLNCLDNKATEANVKEKIYSSAKPFSGSATNISNVRKGKTEGEKGKTFDWDSLRRRAQSNGKRERSKETMDSLNYETLRCAEVSEISNAIKERGMNNLLAERIKDFLNRLDIEHGSIDLEWLRDVPPDKAKDYLLSVRGLGLKSVECVRLLTLHHLAFPVDTNVGRIAVRLGWVPLQPLPESLQLHLLELYPMLETIQKYLWPRLCKLDQRTLYELHYQMITFGKVFCTKKKPNCNACPMRGECRHFASAFASARLALPGPEERTIVNSAIPIATNENPAAVIKPMLLPLTECNSNKEAGFIDSKCEPIVEEPSTPEPETTVVSESDIEDAFYEDPEEIPTIKLNIEEFALNLHNYMQDNNMALQEGDMSKALVALNPVAASIPTPKLKYVNRLRTEHQVYELPDSHALLEGLDKREPDDPSPYLLTIWTPGETANSVQPPESWCQTQESGKMCNDKTCFTCNSIRESNSQTVRGTLLIPCRTAMRGSFPLNGTYFQVNEMFADHESSLNPIDVPRAWIWNLPRRTVYFGTSVSAIFKGLSTEDIQYCFWRGFVCVRGFDHKTRAPRPLMARLHFPASKLVRTKNEEK